MTPAQRYKELRKKKTEVLQYSFEDISRVIEVLNTLHTVKETRKIFIVKNAQQTLLVTKSKFFRQLIFKNK